MYGRFFVGNIDEVVEDVTERGSFTWGGERGSLECSEGGGQPGNALTLTPPLQAEPSVLGAGGSMGNEELW